MTGQRPLAVIHAQRGATELEAPNHQSRRGVQLLVAMPCSVLKIKESEGERRWISLSWMFAAIFCVAGLNKAN